MFKLDLGRNFFVLSTEYKTIQLKEFHYLIKRGYSYSDLLIMPIYVRRFFIQHINEMENG